jgi:hypothetical protein
MMSVVLAGAVVVVVVGEIKAFRERITKLSTARSKI